MRWLELNEQNTVTNIVVWDGESPYSPAGVSQLLPCDEHPGVSFGWRMVDGVWIEPEAHEDEATE
jgi:hypothetical protein